MLIFSIIFVDKIYSLTNNEIIEFCRRERNSQECMRTLRIRRYQLIRGKPIEIPIDTYKKINS